MRAVFITIAAWDMDKLKVALISGRFHTKEISRENGQVVLGVFHPTVSPHRMLKRIRAAGAKTAFQWTPDTFDAIVLFFDPKIGTLRFFHDETAQAVPKAEEMGWALINDDGFFSEIVTFQKDGATDQDARELIQALHLVSH